MAILFQRVSYMLHLELFTQKAATPTTTGQACDRCMFKKTELDIKSPVGPTMVGAETKMLVLSDTDRYKTHFSQPGKYSIINKSTTFATFYHSFTLLYFYIILTRISHMKFLKVSSRKTRTPVKPGKIKCLMGPLNDWYVFDKN